MESRLIATALDQLALNSIKAGYLPITLLSGALAYFALTTAIEKDGMAITNGSWNVLSTICGTVIGSLYWSEELTPKNVAGLFIGCISLFLMNGVE